MRQLTLEQNLQRRVVDLLATLFGRENVRVTLRVDMDFAARQTVTEKYDPDGQVARSSFNRQGGETSAPSDAGNPFEERVDFEISKSTSTVVEADGIIRKLNAAVLINSEAGAVTADQLREIEPLLRVAIGFNESRGDRLEIARLPFSSMPAGNPGFPGEFPAQLSPYFLAIAGFIAAAMLVLFSTASIRRRRQPHMIATSLPTDRPATSAPALRDPPGVTEIISASSLSTSELRVRVAQLVDQNPDRALAIMRSWLHETVTEEIKS